MTKTGTYPTQPVLRHAPSSAVPLSPHDPPAIPTTPVSVVLFVVRDVHVQGRLLFLHGRRVVLLHAQQLRIRFVGPVGGGEWKCGWGSGRVDEGGLIGC